MIQAIEKQNISNIVYEKMMDMVVQGTWKQGDMIPSENELCEAFSVSRNTIRQAIQRLSALGILNSRQGRGTFVSEIDAGAYLNLLIPTVFLGEKDALNVFQYMKAIQVESVRIACKTASDKELLFLDTFIEQMKAADNYIDFFNYDMDYHHYIAHLTNNPLFVKSMEIAAKLLHVYLEDIVALHGGSTSLEQHKDCYNALLERDVDKAVKIMENHYATIMDRLGKLLNG